MKAEAMLIGQVETLWVVFFKPSPFYRVYFQTRTKKSDLEVEREGTSGGIDPWFPEVT